MEHPLEGASSHKTTTGKLRRDELLTNYRNSGLTQREYARREGINYNTFVAWLARKRRRDEMTELASAVREAKSSSSDPTTREGRLEVVLNGQIVIRGDDPEAVGRLVQTLRKQME